MANPWNASAFPTPESRSAPAVPARPVLVFRRTARGDTAVRTASNVLPLHLARLLMLFEAPLSVDDLRQMISDPWLPDGIVDLQRRKLIERLPPPGSVAPQIAPAITPAMAPAGAPSDASSEMPVLSADALVGLRSVAQTTTHTPAKLPVAPNIVPVGLARPGHRFASGPGVQVDAADPALSRRRDQVRLLFLQQLGELGNEMGRRIGRCTSDAELDELMPQVRSLVEALAGRVALADFHARLVAERPAVAR